MGAQCPSGSSPWCPKNPRTRQFPVVGDSMLGAAICDGDTVVVRQADSADHGDIVAAMLNAEATVKRLRRENGRVWLMPHNPNYEPIPGDEATVLGKVVSVLRTV
ncbi:LexA family protein [[Kitasatospora] papulosa]|uniref:LexA family protein n=1 Tax=[Kitasatospora] papulosa TaxID=1464011 RepID=UPI003679912C